ncbi:DUF6984 family protein [Dyella tabacisoli]|uniref:DUF6984 domain-containing protein n=1 Tax=Dyella tabacisoli TaxID=2282381 RepID=A0A369UQU4_9GAMM|nr:hypothetical protein [Dyella tabacisoli]RDD82881.1 hypothetical protein DVJ77_05035 [Dyella tabacisoli]
MSVESLHQDLEKSRPLRDDEKFLLTALLASRADFTVLSRQISTCSVYDMSDGGMGSVKFLTVDERLLGDTLVEAECEDADGVPVFIAINADTRGELYEIDLWKADFSPLKQYPKPELVRIRND